MTNTPFIVWPDDENPQTEQAALLGGKANALRRLHEADLPIPPWFVLVPAAFHTSLSPGQDAALAVLDDASALQAFVAAMEPAPAVCQALANALERLCPQGESVAVRSSAVDEDGADHSFAGQLDSFLFVSPGDVGARVVQVWRSGFSERLLAYRRERGLSLAPCPPAVLIQRMVHADVSGVAFSADPISGRRGVALVAAVYGLGTSLVGGDADADTFHVARDGQTLDRKIATKQVAHRAAADTPEGVRAEAVNDEDAARPALTDAQVWAVATLARQAQSCAGRPQDIEWAVENGTLYLLQSRPITTLAGLADPDGVCNVWDNSNIAESYNGVTTPLTFSFARHAYEHVYRAFCRLLRVRENRIQQSDATFRNLLGLVRGRVYYNLPHWYRLLALLPGYQTNRTFMEQMMGVREGLPEELVAVRTPTGRERLRDKVDLVRCVVGLVQSHRGLERQITHFLARLDQALAPSNETLAAMRPDELAAHYQDLEQQLLSRWDAPLVNDFFAMIFHGVLRRLTEKWCGEDDQNLHNDLVSGDGGIVSAEPALRIRQMAAQLVASDQPELVHVLCDAPARAALRAARQQNPELAAAFDSYLDKFGDRCLEELKLESSTLHDDPTPLVRAVGFLARRGATDPPNQPSSDTPRQVAERRAKAALARHPLRRLLYHYVLRNARRHVRNRENLRFERTRVFGRVRRLFVEIGRRFHADGLLDDARDIFYLETSEILGMIAGTATCSDARGLAAVRRAEFDRFRAAPPPGDRFETRGMVCVGNDYADTRTVAEDGADDHDHADERKGIACCPGRVRGPVRVITDPRNATLTPGTILVAERTDPGWILLFPAASALLVERGSLLSHSAIVAREMNLPAIVSIPGVTRWLRDGDVVEMDGGSGGVRRVNASEEQDCG